MHTINNGGDQQIMQIVRLPPATLIPTPVVVTSYKLHIMYKYAEIETCQVEVLVMVMLSLSEDTNNIMMKITKECLTKAIQYWINFGFSCETL